MPPSFFYLSHNILRVDNIHHLPFTLPGFPFYNQDLLHTFRISLLHLKSFYTLNVPLHITPFYTKSLLHNSPDVYSTKMSLLQLKYFVYSCNSVLIEHYLICGSPNLYISFTPLTSPKKNFVLVLCNVVSIY